MGISIPNVNTAALARGRSVFHAISHQGLQRKSNEDRFLIKCIQDDAVMIAVADGLGNEPAGSAAAEIVRQSLCGIESIPENREKTELERIARQIDRTVHSEGQCRPNAEGMGSTLLAVLLRRGNAYWVHVGDSRLYLFRNGTLQQITEDQTLARFLVAENEITPEQSQIHYSQCVMDQCVGCGYVEPETGNLQVFDHDWIILSTDGLHKLIAPDDITSILNTPADIETKAEALVRAALDAGGPDNITVILMRS
jgi:PPM family protein phosphatase